MARTLKSYRHFPVTEARDLLQTFNAERYKVVTVNWTYARKRGQKEQDRSMVHRNEYEFTLEQLIQFIRDTGDVAEDIVAIVPLSSNRRFERIDHSAAAGATRFHSAP